MTYGAALAPGASAAPSRGGLRQALALCLVGSVTALLALSRTWSSTTAEQPAPLPPLTSEVAGGALAPGVRALALVALAGVVALLAARGWGRVAVGAVLVVTGAGIAVGSLSAEATSAWPWLAAAGGAGVLGAGLLTAVQGRRWAGLSDAYRPPAARAADPDSVTPEAGDKRVWDALDRGEDPTA